MGVAKGLTATLQTRSVDSEKLFDKIVMDLDGLTTGQNLRHQSIQHQLATMATMAQNTGGSGGSGGGGKPQEPLVTHTQNNNESGQAQRR